MTRLTSLQGKRLLVIGGETPLGRAVAVGAAEAGAAVAIASRERSTDAEFAVNSALNELWAMDRRGVALVIDASDEADAREAVERAQAELGPLDLAVVISDERTSPAVETLRQALGGRSVVSLTPETSREDALRALEQVV